MNHHDKQTWTVASAKAQLSQVIDQAQTEPQMITRNGKPSVVVVSAEEWDRKTKRQGTLASFLRASPLAGSDIDVTRSPDGLRDVEI